jgi:DNA-binding response OmpR family regulator
MAPRTPGTILVIDDDPRLVRALALLLRRDGYRVETARNGRHALAQLQAQRYDVIVSDLAMPEMDGHAFYLRLQQQCPWLAWRVIFLTGASSEAPSVAFLAQCGQPWLAKPCPIAALRRAIQQVLGRATSAQ